MSYRNSPILIRASRLEDEEDLIEIGHLTGDTQIDPYLLALRYCLDYLWHDTHNCFVAEDPDAGKVVGYILGTLNTRQQEERLRRIMLPKFQAYWRKLKPKNFAQWRAYLLIRASLWTPYPKMLSTYPAHLHINIHPNYQRNGLGSLLLEAYEQNLILNGVAGYHLGVYGNNQVGISFYEKKGLTRLRQLPGMGKPYVIFYGRKLK